MTDGRLEAFLRGLRAVLEAKRGRKAELARFLGVRPHQVSEWLAGVAAPNSEHLLGMQEWLSKHSPSRGKPLQK